MICAAKSRRCGRRSKAESDDFRGALGKKRRIIIIAEQLALGLCDVEAQAILPAPANDDGRKTEQAGARKKPKRNIGALPAHLPRFDILIEPETTICSCCAGALHRIGEDVNEVLDKIPAVLRVLRMTRPKYACQACEGEVVQAKARPRLIEGGMVSTALVAWIASAKYALGLDAVSPGADPRRPGRRRRPPDACAVDEAVGLDGQGPLRAAVGDDASTASPVLRRDADAGARSGRGRTKVCQFWAHACDDRSWNGPAPLAVAYVFAGGRGKKEIAAQLAGFKGILQVDGYSAYKSLAADKKGDGTIRLAFCLVHARRNFVDVLKTTGSPFAKEVIERIGAVYAIEKGSAASTPSSAAPCGRPRRSR